MTRHVENDATTNPTISILAALRKATTARHTTHKRRAKISRHLFELGTGITTPNGAIKKASPRITLLTMLELRGLSGFVSQLVSL